MATAQVDAALDLVKRLPPENVVNTLSSLVELAPSLTEELLSRVDQPLQARANDLSTCPSTAFPYQLFVPHRLQELTCAPLTDLQVAMDTKANKEFLICDYNRDADSYRCQSLF